MKRAGLLPRFLSVLRPNWPFPYHQAFEEAGRNSLFLLQLTGLMITEGHCS